MKTSTQTNIGRARMTTFRVNAELHTYVVLRSSRFNVGRVIVLNNPPAAPSHRSVGAHVEIENQT
jgi:hypothetical protein